ncbi:hypothetical protein CPT_Madawaska_257 [Staphylococcus phage Madawaska]|nr:hypothetical protein CPT_Madawaska_257 [Staphylococcus phage Madawaska]
MFKIYPDYSEFLKRELDYFGIDIDDVAYHSDINIKEKLESIEKDDNEMGINYLNLGDISLNTEETSGAITIRELVDTIDHLIYTENEVTPLYYFFMDKIDSLPMINMITYKKAANSFYEEYKTYNTGDHSAYINIKGEWKQLSFNQFKESLKEVLLSSHKESNVDKLFKELNNLTVKDNFS